MSSLNREAFEKKAALRRMIWSKMESMEVVTAPRPCYGKIPGFVGLHSATQRIIKTEAFRTATTIYTTPDVSTRLLREEALRHGKKLVISIPGLRGYILLDPAVFKASEIRYVSSMKGAVRRGEKIPFLENVKIDLVVLGSVAVNNDGARLGRGDGLYDLEYAILRETYSITAATPIVTLVHDTQIINEPIPMLIHDVPVDMIASPSGLIRVSSGKYKKPPGIFWEMLPIDFIKSTGILRKLFGIS
jgi:5-formyltetrahydrofolate cyclo-ligase